MMGQAIVHVVSHDAGMTLAQLAVAGQVSPDGEVTENASDIAAVGAVIPQIAVDAECAIADA